jgi:hypothetical protein
MAQFFSSQQGVALAVESDTAMGIYRSSDGGKTWVKVGDVPL